MDGLRRFGITDDSSSLLAVKVVKSSEELEAAYKFLITTVKGAEISVTDSNINSRCEIETTLKRNYKLPNTLDLTNAKVVNTALVGALTLRGS